MCIVSSIFWQCLVSLQIMMRALFSSWSGENCYIIYQGKTEAYCIGMWVGNSSSILRGTFLQLFPHSGFVAAGTARQQQLEIRRAPPICR